MTVALGVVVVAAGLLVVVLGVLGARHLEDGDGRELGAVGFLPDVAADNAAEDLVVELLVEVGISAPARTARRVGLHSHSAVAFSFHEKPLASRHGAGFM